MQQEQPLTYLTVSLSKPKKSKKSADYEEVSREHLHFTS